MNRLLMATAACVLLAASVYGGTRARDVGQGPTVEPQCSAPEDLVKGIYQQLLERVPDPETVQTLTAQLAAGTKRVRDLIRDAALSDEFKGKYMQGRTEEEAVRLLYQRILSRGGSPQEYRPWVEAAKAAHGFTGVINGLIDGPEYAREFGERGVPGRPVGLRACRFPATLSRDEEVGPGQKMATTLTISAGGQIDLVTKIENGGAGAGSGFCGRVGLWLLDENDGVVGIVGPARGERWCLGGPGPRPAQRTDEWHGQLDPETLRKVSAVAVLQTSSASDPLDPTRENTARAKQSKQSMR